MICLKCGMNNTDNSNVCINCGADLRNIASANNVQIKPVQIHDVTSQVANPQPGMQQPMYNTYEQQPNNAVSVNQNINDDVTLI